MRAHRARERERVAGGQADVADQREAVAELVGELAQVATLSRGRLHDVGPATLRRRGRRGRRPHVDELHLEQRRRRGHCLDHALALSEADLDRHAFAVRPLSWLHVRGDPLAVAEPQDRFT